MSLVPYGDSSDSDSDADDQAKQHDAKTTASAAAPPTSVERIASLPTPKQPTHSFVLGASSKAAGKKVRITAPPTIQADDDSDDDDIKRDKTKTLGAGKRKMGLVDFLPKPKQGRREGLVSTILHQVQRPSGVRPPPPSSTSAKSDPATNKPLIGGSVLSSVVSDVPDAPLEKIRLNTAFGAQSCDDTHQQAEMEKARFLHNLMGKSTNVKDSPPRASAFTSCPDIDAPSRGDEPIQPEPIEEVVQVASSSKQTDRHDEKILRAIERSGDVEAELALRSNADIVDVRADEFTIGSERAALMSVTGGGPRPPPGSNDTWKKAVDKNARRKHQITYLAAQAKACEEELKDAWAVGHANRKSASKKYGF